VRWLPFDAVQIALVDGVDAHEAGAPAGPWGLANPDGVAHGTGLGEADATGLVVRAFAQVVQVRDRQIGQAFIARVAVHGVGTLQEVRNGRAAHVLMGPIHLDQQFDIHGRVLARKGRGRGAVLLDQWMLRHTVTCPARDQASQLRAAVAAGAAQVAQHHAAFALVALRVVKPRQHAADVLVALVVVRAAHTVRCEPHLGRRPEKFLQLLDRAQPRVVHVDHHPCDDQLAPRFAPTGQPSGSFLVGNRHPVQAHTMLDKALAQQQLGAAAHYAYLGLYILGYIADDSLMVALSVIALGSGKLTERTGRWLKFLSGLVMLLLGGVMLLRPEWLV
jgi:hypothetical protein